MYEFLDRLITIAMPRIRDFRGVSAKAFDGRGNYAMGLKEHIVFPEIDFRQSRRELGYGHRHLHHSQTDAEAKSAVEAFQHALQQLSAGRK